MKIIKKTKWIKAVDLRNKIIYVQTIFEVDKNGKVFSRRNAIRQKIA
ncbi:MAG: hypothetical protein GY853_01625 [PVC group bacterium]|nr:hypothetical protein [PVC group bacterium]